MTEVLAAHAAVIAWEHGLRGHDAAQLAAALFKQDMLGEVATVTTYDRQSWSAAEATGLDAWPSCDRPKAAARQYSGFVENHFGSSWRR
jgi:hypothetical protein